MKRVSLRTKLITTYLLLSIFLIASTLLISSHFIKKQFQVYSIHKQNMKNQEIISLIASNYNQDGSPPSHHFFQSLGKNLLEQGIILMAYDSSGKELFCMTTEDGKSCRRHMGDLESTLLKNSPDYKGEYSEKDFEVVLEGKPVASVRLGYYGLYYYLENDYNFLNSFNRIFLVVAVVSLLASLLIGIFMATRLGSPLQKVTKQTVDIANGLYNKRTNLKTTTAELDDLSRSVDHLAESLQTQLRLKKRMASDYSHEFRTPLAAMQANIEAIMDGVWDATPERMQSLHTELLRLSRMVDSIDQLVQFQSMRIALNKTRFDLSEIIPGILLTFEREIEDKKIQVAMDLSSCEIEADLDKITQVAVNLISNAVKYNNTGGILEIYVGKQGDSGVIKVTDGGIGISQEDLPHVFDHLFRTDISRNRDTGGNGIGLSIVKAIVESHRGDIFVESDPAVGTSFTVVLPYQANIE